MPATEAPLRVFLYGTLLDPAILAARAGRNGLRGVPAVLPGWRRVALRGQPYPTLIRARRHAVRGVVVALAGAPLRRLRAYEGAAYRLAFVRVIGPHGRIAARAWITAPALADPGIAWRGAAPSHHAMTNQHAK